MNSAGSVHREFEPGAHLSARGALNQLGHGAGIGALHADLRPTTQREAMLTASVSQG